MQDLLVPENLLNPVLVKHVKEIEAAEKAQVKGQKAQETAQENAREQGGQMAGRWAAHASPHCKIESSPMDWIKPPHRGEPAALRTETRTIGSMPFASLLVTSATA